MTALTRREILRRGTIGAGAAGLLPGPATALGGRRRGLSGVPPLDGVLLTDPASRALAADDYGHVVHRTPRAVLRPGSVEDVVKIVRYARERGLRVSARGEGHSTFGQSQVRDGIVVDMRTLSRLRAIQADRAVVQAGITWRTLITASAARGLTPPSLPDYQDLSVGGTLSLGGTDSGPMLHGAHIDNVLELDVVTGAGELLTCSESDNRDLFDAVLGGLGQCGVIVNATLRLIAAPTHALFARLHYPELEANLADAVMLARTGRFNAFETLVMGDTGTWLFDLHGAAYLTGGQAPDVAALVQGLNDDASRRVVTVVPYLAWLFRMDVPITVSRGFSYAMFDAHLPAATAPAFLEEVFAHTPEEVGGLHHILPVSSNRALSRPLLQLPAEVNIGCMLLRDGKTPEEARAQLPANRHLYDRAVEAGGKRYPFDAIPGFTRQDWKRHFGSAWPAFQRAKRRYDPDGILGAGVGVFG